MAGPLILWLKYGGLAGAGAWFWIKMAPIVVMLTGVIHGGINFKKSQHGDAEAARLADIGHGVTAIAGLGVVLAAVFAFN